MSKRKAKMEYIVIGSDFHVPFVEDKAFSAFKSMVKDIKPSKLIINGDFMDFYTVSKYSKDPERKVTLAYELLMGKTLLKELRAAVGDAPIVYLEGNHEIRLRQFLSTFAPQLASLPHLKIQELLGLSEMGIDYISARSRGAFVQVDNIVVGHFDRVSKNSGQTAKALVDDHMCNIVQAHTHRLGTFYKTTIGGNYVGVECGCMCETDPDYLDTANWQQGCVILQRESGETDWQIVEVPIINGKIRFNGNIYE